MQLKLIDPLLKEEDAALKAFILSFDETSCYFSSKVQIKITLTNFSLRKYIYQHEGPGSVKNKI